MYSENGCMARITEILRTGQVQSRFEHVQYFKEAKQPELQPCRWAHLVAWQRTPKRGLKMDLNFGSNLGPTTVVGPLLRSFLGSAFRHPSEAILFHEMWGLDNPLCSKRKLSKFQFGIAKSCQSVSRLASTPSSKIAPMDCKQDLFPGPSTLSITIQRRIQLGGKCTVQLSQRAADGYVDCYP